MTFALCLEGREGVSHGDTWGKAFLAEGTASAKAKCVGGLMGQQGGLHSWSGMWQAGGEAEDTGWRLGKDHGTTQAITETLALS